MFLRSIFVCLLLCSLAGCSQLIAGQVDSAMDDMVVPWLMATDDMDAACRAGTAMAPMMGSFALETEPPRRAALMTYMSSGICAERAAWAEELREARALHGRDARVAMDARLSARRLHALAARRFQAAYHHMLGMLGPIDEICPELSHGRDAFYLVLGLTSAVSAVRHDQLSGRQIGLDSAVLHHISRAAECLDRDAYWGVPRALRAAIALSLPADTRHAEQWLGELEHAAEHGESRGVGLARGIQVLVLDMRDDRERLGAALEAHRAWSQRGPTKPQHQLLSGYGLALVQRTTDAHWSRRRGHRTPPQQWGRLPADGDADKRAQPRDE